MVAFDGTLCYDKTMKKRDIILIAAVLLVVAGTWFLVRPLYRGNSSKLAIQIENKLYGTYNLDEDQEISLNETNICRIENGSVSMIWADCPDQVCVHSSSIHSFGQTIICMPNRIVLEITDGSSDGIDAIVN